MESSQSRQLHSPTSDGKKRRSKFSPVQQQFIKKAVTSVPIPSGTMEQIVFWGNIRKMYRSEFPDHIVTDVQIRDHGYYWQRKQKQTSHSDQVTLPSSSVPEFRSCDATMTPTLRSQNDKMEFLENVALRSHNNALSEHVESLKAENHLMLKQKQSLQREVTKLQSGDALFYIKLRHLVQASALLEAQTNDLMKFLARG